MTEILLSPRGDNYMLIVKSSGRAFHGEFLQHMKGGYVSVKLPLGITSEEKMLLDNYGNIIIAQGRWQIWKMNGGEYCVDRY